MVGIAALARAAWRCWPQSAAPRVTNFAADLSPFARRQVSRTAQDCLEDTASLLAKPQRQKTESLRQSSQAVRRCTERRHWRLVARSCQAAHICREVPP